MKKFEVFRGSHVIVTVSHIGYVINDDCTVKYRAKVTILRKTGVGSGGMPRKFAEIPSDADRHDSYDVEMISADDSCEVIKQINVLVAKENLVERDIQAAHKNGMLGMYAIEGFCDRLAD